MAGYRVLRYNYNVAHRDFDDVTRAGSVHGAQVDGRRPYRIAPTPLVNIGTVVTNFRNQWSVGPEYS
jgi:hypothetical protein